LNRESAFATGSHNSIQYGTRKSWVASF